MAEEALFQVAALLPAEERAAFLDRECGGDGALRARLAALLAAHDQPETLECLGSGGHRPTIALDLPANPGAADDSVGLVIGRYKLLERIGEGGCGVVYVAEQSEPVHRRVALKLIKPGMDSKAVIARFEAERQALAMMDHPGIARVFDAGTTNAGRPYFVMELVRGIRITEYSDQEKLPLRDRLDLFIKVCQAIQHAHQKGIIHRDIKPSNILVTLHDGVPVPKVIDFGIAKATAGRLTDATVYTQLHQFIGTPAYMSPEQAEMSGLDIDTRSDIYSLGVLLYELLTGVTPFDAKELMSQGLDAMRRTIREKEPLRPSTRLTQLQSARSHTPFPIRDSRFPSDLDWIVMKCLEKDRIRRYPTAQDLAADLRRHLGHEPVQARPPSAWYQVQKAWRRHRLVFASGATVAAVLVASVVVLSWALQDQKRARRDAEDAEIEQSRQRAHAEAAGRTATEERDRAARLLSVSQAEQGVRLLEQGDPIGLLHLLEARRTVDHLPEERIRRTLLWSGWMNSLPKPEWRWWSPQPAGATPDNWVARPSTPGAGLPWIAKGGTEGDVTLSDPDTGRAIARFSTGGRRVGSPGLSANGTLLIVNVEGSFQLWDLAPVRSNQPPRPLLDRILRFAMDPVRRRLLTFDNPAVPLPGRPSVQSSDHAPDARYRLQIWDSTTEDPLVTTWSGDRQDLVNHEFALSADGSRVAAGFHTLTLWDARSGEPASPPLGTNGTGVAHGPSDPFWFSPSGQGLWVVNGAVCALYDMNTGRPKGASTAGLHRFQRPWVSPGGDHLVLSLTNGFQVIHLDRGEPMGPIIAISDDNVRALALSADGLRLATSGPDRALRVWDTKTGRQWGPTHMPPRMVTSAAFTSDGSWLWFDSVQTEFNTRELSTTSQSTGSGMVSLTIPPADWVKDWQGVRVLGVRDDGEVLTYSNADKAMAWRNPASDRISREWPVSDSGAMIGSALSPDGAMVAAAFQSGREGSEVRLWDSITGRQLEPSITWTNQGSLAFSPDGRTLAGLVGNDGTGSIQLWDVATRQSGAILPSAPKQITWLALWFSPDARFIAARNSYAISVWDVAAGRLASGSPMDFYLAISDDWKWAIGLELLDFTDPRDPRPPPNPVASRDLQSKRAGLALSPDGRWRAAQAGDLSLRLWDNTTERPVGHEMKLSGLPRQAVFSPDGRFLVLFESSSSGGRSGQGMNLRFWETSTGLPLAPAVALRDQPVEFLFDRDSRILTQKAPFETSQTLVILLPEREVPLAEMERQSWKLSGCRLDDSGNVDILTQRELQRLETVVPPSSAGSP
ncbi:MAG: protein kinase [Verrucomicrobiae bacterium]|nr:protein kinase [Verrucomicrobiae bacterium]